MRLRFEHRLLLDIALLLAPAALLCLFLYTASTDSRLAIGAWLAGLAAALTLGLALRLQQRIVFPLYTLSNLLEALREGDYSLRGSRARRGDAMGDVVWEVNALSATLRDQRLRAEEAGALLDKVIRAIDIALLSFDPEHGLTLVNPAGAALLGAPRSELIGRSAAELGLDECLAIEGSGLVTRAFPGASGSFDLRRFRIRQQGRPQDLLVITDLSRALRDQERQAWQKLIRVLGHELNNSLAAIGSMSATLHDLLAREPLPEDWREDTEGGLRLIRDRSEALSRFMLGYTTLARLPAPNRRTLDLGELLQRVAQLEQRVPVRLSPPPETWIEADPDQLEQALINLLRNAAEAALDGDRDVQLRAAVQGSELQIEVLDSGPGLSGSDNLFVPFFTTKPGGSGIGLALARQIAEAHGGRVELSNRPDRRGCRALLVLPVGGPSASG